MHDISMFTVYHINFRYVNLLKLPYISLGFHSADSKKGKIEKNQILSRHFIFSKQLLFKYILEPKRTLTRIFEKLEKGACWITFGPLDLISLANNKFIKKTSTFSYKINQQFYR